MAAGTAGARRWLTERESGHSDLASNKYAFYVRAAPPHEPILLQDARARGPLRPNSPRLLGQCHSKTRRAILVRVVSARANSKPVRVFAQNNDAKGTYL